MITETITTIITLAIAYLAYRLYNKSKGLQLELKKSLSKIKSLYILHGQYIENLAPFSKHFKGEPKEVKFLGMPIDFIGFHQDGVVFYEIKSGLSQLSPKQKMIRKHIEEGRVTFEEVRYNGN